MALENNSRLAYKRVEQNARDRADETREKYLESVPQAEWLRLDVNGTVLMTPEEFSVLPGQVRGFFTDGNMSHYKKDRVGLRGENIILLDGHYSGGVASNLRCDRFLSVAQQYLDSVPMLLPQLSDQNKEQRKAKLAIWENLSSLSVAQFHALKALSLLENDSTIEETRAKRDMSHMFEGYFNTVLGISTDHYIDQTSDSLKSIIDSVSSQHELFIRHGPYDLFRTEREASGAYALMGAFSWVNGQKLLETDTVIGILLGGIDGTEAVKFLECHRDVFGFSAEQFPTSYEYILPRVKPIGQTARVVGKRWDAVPLFDEQENLFQNIPKDSHIAIIDDMITTGSTVKELGTILNNHDINSIQLLVNQVGTRWAINDVAPPEILDSVHAVAVSPTTRTFRGKHLGVEKLLQRMRSHQSLDAIRQVSRGSEIITYLQKAKTEGAARGVGFDIFGTLLEEPSYNRGERMGVLQNLWLSKIRTWVSEVALDTFLSTYNRIREHTETRARDARGPHAEFRDDEFWLGILDALGVSHAREKIHEMLSVELEYDKQIRRPVPQMVDAVREAVHLFGENAVGVFSNSRMPREHVIDLLKIHGFAGGKGMLKQENILVSSDLGVKKPDARTVDALSQRLGIPTREIIFIGNDIADIRAAGRAQAIGVQLVSAPDRKKEIKS